jgi:hypothetical protein
MWRYLHKLGKKNRNTPGNEDKANSKRNKKEQNFYRTIQGSDQSDIDASSKDFVINPVLI